MSFLVRVILVAYTIFMLKPAMPLVMDSLAHAFWANVHIVTVHKHNGKSHVHYELRKMSHANEREHPGQKSKTVAIEDDVHIAGVVAGPVQFLHQVSPPAGFLQYYLQHHNNAEQFVESPPPKKTKMPFPVASL